MNPDELIPFSRIELEFNIPADMLQRWATKGRPSKRKDDPITRYCLVYSMVNGRWMTTRRNVVEFIEKVDIGKADFIMHMAKILNK